MRRRTLYRLVGAGFLCLLPMVVILSCCSNNSNVAPLNVCELNNCSLENRYREELERMGSPSPNACTLLVLVFSRGESSFKRNISRVTWIEDTKSRRDVSVFFVVGTRGLSEEARRGVSSEEREHGDLLLLPEHEDTYANLTGKLQAALGWAVENRADCSYVMKGDDDCYIMVDRLLPTLRTRSPKDPLLWGSIQWHARPMKEGKWAEHNWLYGTEYLPYPLGTGYVLSFPLINTIMRATSPLRTLANDDVSIGLWVAPYQVEYKTFGVHVYAAEDKCLTSEKDIVVFHFDQSPSKLYEAHHILTCRW